eukprot:520425-Rhodomonas_salina.1
MLTFISDHDNRPGCNTATSPQQRPSSASTDSAVNILPPPLSPTLVKVPPLTHPCQRGWRGGSLASSSPAPRIYCLPAAAP